MWPSHASACYHEQLDQTTRKLMVGKNGHPIRIRHVFYYWFVGSHSLTAGHYDRTFIDMKDRLLGGFDQRWAYVLLGGQITDTLVMNACSPAIRPTRAVDPKRRPTHSCRSSSPPSAAIPSTGIRSTRTACPVRRLALVRAFGTPVWQFTVAADGASTHPEPFDTSGAGR